MVNVVPKQLCDSQMSGHTCDIRSMALYPPSTLASGSDDGEVILWNLESGFAKFKLHDVAQKRTALQTPNTRFYNSSQSIAVEQLVFLPTSAILVASYGDGWLRFW